MPGRDGALLGTTIRLVVKFKDAMGNLADPESSPYVDIFPPGKNPQEGSTTDADALILNASQTSLGSPAGMHYVVREGVGCYSFEFDIPSLGDTGVYFDRWNGTLTSQPLEEVFMFVAVGGGSIGTGQLKDNNRVTVFIDKDLLCTDDQSLGNDFEYYFTTTYKPLYSSVRRIRLDLGPLVEQIPDDTINLSIFEASLMADAITFNSPINDDYFTFVRREYVTCLAASRILSNQVTQGKSKRLGDLQVDFSGDPNDKIKDALQCLKQYEPVLRTGGDISTGTSLKPKVAVKGVMDMDRPAIGRLWTTTQSGPAANTKVRSGNRIKNSFKGSISRWWKTRWE